MTAYKPLIKKLFNLMRKSYIVISFVFDSSYYCSSHIDPYIYGSILPGHKSMTKLCSCFVGENSTPVSMIRVQIKFRKIGLINNLLLIMFE